MGDFLSNIQPVTSQSLFIQPYNESIHNFKKAVNKEYPLADRIKHAIAGVSLLVPIINTIAYLIFRGIQTSVNKGLKELHFTVEDVNKLAKLHFGLRHTSSHEDFTRELQEGFVQGCSLNISPEKGALKAMKGRSWSKVDIQERKRYVENFEKGVDDFIQSSIAYDAHQYNRLIQLNHTHIEEIASLVDKCRFCIINYSDQSSPHSQSTTDPCDFHAWGHGLGRYPKRDIPGKNIVGLPVLSVDNLGLSSKQLSSAIETRAMGDELYQRITACYRTLLIQFLRAQVS